MAFAGTAFAEIKVHQVTSEYQNGPQEIRVLLPDTYTTTKKYRVVYVLPVECGFASQCGYGLGEIEKLQAQNTYDAIFVQMGFEKTPWFGDHEKNPKIRQDSYLREFVVPFVEKNYSTVGSVEGRLLFGFSKSGWGAFSLILKYPDFFGYAAAWDAPWMFDNFYFGMDEVFGTLEQLKKYRTDLLVSTQASSFRTKKRLVLTGETAWGKMIPTPQGGAHTPEFHKLLESLGILHDYDNTMAVLHRWDPAWMKPTLQYLMKLGEQVHNP